MGFQKKGGQLKKRERDRLDEGCGGGAETEPEKRKRLSYVLVDLGTDPR